MHWLTALTPKGWPAPGTVDRLLVQHAPLDVTGRGRTAAGEGAAEADPAGEQEGEAEGEGGASPEVPEAPAAPDTPEPAAKVRRLGPQLGLRSPPGSRAASEAGSDVASSAPRPDSAGVRVKPGAKAKAGPKPKAKAGALGNLQGLLKR